MTIQKQGRDSHRDRYAPDDDGLRFQDLTYTGNFVGMEPVVDGIKGASGTSSGSGVARRSPWVRASVSPGA